MDLKMDVGLLIKTGHRVTTKINKKGIQVDKIYLNKNKNDVWVSTSKKIGLVCIDKIEHVEIDRQKNFVTLFKYENKTMKKYDIPDVVSNVWDVQEIGLFTKRSLELKVEG
jgi:hypothetical protein